MDGNIRCTDIYKIDIICTEREKKCESKKEGGERKRDREKDTHTHTHTNAHTRSARIERDSNEREILYERESVRE